MTCGICEADFPAAQNNYSKPPLVGLSLTLSKSGLKGHLWTVPRIMLLEEHWKYKMKADHLGLQIWFSVDVCSFLVSLVS